MIPSTRHQSGLEDQTKSEGQGTESSGKAKTKSGVEEAGAKDKSRTNGEKTEISRSSDTKKDAKKQKNEKDTAQKTQSIQMSQAKRTMQRWRKWRLKLLKSKAYRNSQIWTRKASQTGKQGLTDRQGNPERSKARCICRLPSPTHNHLLSPMSICKLIGSIPSLPFTIQRFPLLHAEWLDGRMHHCW